MRRGTVIAVLGFVITVVGLALILASNLVVYNGSTTVFLPSTEVEYLPPGNYTREKIVTLGRTGLILDSQSPSRATAHMRVTPQDLWVLPSPQCRDNPVILQLFGEGAYKGTNQTALLTISVEARSWENNETKKLEASIAIPPTSSAKPATLDYGDLGIRVILMPMLTPNTPDPVLARSSTSPTPSTTTPGPVRVDVVNVVVDRLREGRGAVLLPPPLDISLNITTNTSLEFFKATAVAVTNCIYTETLEIPQFKVRTIRQPVQLPTPRFVEADELKLGLALAVFGNTLMLLGVLDNTSRRDTRGETSGEMREDRKPLTEGGGGG